MHLARVAIRHVTQEDYSAWLPLWEGYNAFYGRAGSTALPTANTEMTWYRFFDVEEPVHALVAQFGDDLVGIAHYLFHRSTIDIKSVSYLQDLFTAEEFRGRGIGRRLIDGVCEEARQAGAARLYWHTHESNSRAIGLYSKLAENSGFIVFRRSP